MLVFLSNSSEHFVTSQMVASGWVIVCQRYCINLNCLAVLSLLSNMSKLKPLNNGCNNKCPNTQHILVQTHLVDNIAKLIFFKHGSID